MGMYEALNQSPSIEMQKGKAELGKIWDDNKWLRVSNGMSDSEG